MKTRLIISVAVLTAFLFVTSLDSHAGSVLRMKSGTVRLQDQGGQLLKDSHTPELAQGDFIVQFNRPLTSADRAALVAQGFFLRSYLPDDALIVRGATRAAAGLSIALRTVRAVARFEPEWRVSPELLDFGKSSSSARRSLTVIALSVDDLPAVVSRLRQVSGISVRANGGRSLSVDADRSKISEIAAIDGIEWIEPTPVIVTQELALDATDLDSPAPPAPPQVTGYESGNRIVGLETAWARGYTGNGQIVAMADTGLDLGKIGNLHADLGATIAGLPMGLLNFWWDDPMGHGTHVAGSVIGGGNASDGQIRGAAYGASFIAEGMWNRLINNLMVEPNFAKLLGAPYDRGARVHTNSWGAAANFGTYDAMAGQVDEYMFNHPDLLVLFAAGNSGIDKDGDGRIDENSIGSPGTAKNVLTVGASENYLLEGGIQKAYGELRGGENDWSQEPIKSDTPSNNPNGMAAFSSRGPTADGRLKPEIVAPGTNIVSVRSRHKKASQLWGEYDANYVFCGGTSMSTPITAGAATVVREYLVKGMGIATPSAALLKAALIHSATDLFPGQYGDGPNRELPERRPNIHEGYGRVDVGAATQLGESAQVLDDAEGVALDMERELVVGVAEGEALQATLVYTDAPGAANAAQALVNDLDLIVVGPDGKTFTRGDRINNAEMLELAGLAAGSYRVIVRGINVPAGREGRQPYALIVSKR